MEGIFGYTCCPGGIIRLPIGHNWTHVHVLGREYKYVFGGSIFCLDQPLLSNLHTPHFHCSLHTLHFKLHTLHFTPHSLHFTLYTPISFITMRVSIRVRGLHLFFSFFGFLFGQIQGDQGEEESVEEVSSRQAPSWCRLRTPAIYVDHGRGRTLERTLLRPN